MSQIVDMICTDLDAWLAQTMQNLVSETDPSRAVLVKAGRLQDNPVNNYIHVLTQPGDPDKPHEWPHELYRNNMNMQDGSVPAYEVGGESLWWRRGVVELGCFFVQKNYNRDEARNVAHRALGRLEYNLARCQTVLGLVDEFGESTHGIYVVKSVFSEGGGPPAQFIWRGRVWWQVLTSRI